MTTARQRRSTASPSPADPWAAKLADAIALERVPDMDKTLAENGFDSLDVAEFAMWIEDEYGFILRAADEAKLPGRKLSDIKAWAEKKAAK